VWWHKNANGHANKVLEIFASILDFSYQITSHGKLGLIAGLIVMVSMKHNFKASFRDAGAEVFHERPITMQRVNGAPPTKFFRNRLTRSRSMKRHDRERNRSPLRHLAVGMLEFVWCGEKAGVIIADAKVHVMSQRIFLCPTQPTFLANLVL